ncbi:hypothetical protein TNCV_2701111 [Trichonephila clavipes]|nr:hypothetical protein TNCV_2701111 [Trichonephila clavipes]
MLTLLQSVKLLMLRYIVTPPALRIDDDDTATDDMDAICLCLAVLLDYLIKTMHIHWHGIFHRSPDC